MSNKISLEFQTLQKNRSKYRGYIVMVVNDRIFATKRPSSVSQYVKKIEKEYGKRPLITVIPKANSLILLV